MLKFSVLVIALLAVTALGIRGCGTYRWSGVTQSLRTDLAQGRIPLRQTTVDFNELKDLPPPVDRFFRSVLTDGRPMVAGVHLTHSGTFNMSETAEQWRPFTSDQEVVIRRPGFDWNGRIAMLPGLPVYVHDAYVSGEGVLQAAVLGAVTVAQSRDRSQLARGELMRFLAETPWYPTALLPSQGVLWTGADDRSALATIADEALSVTLLFAFQPDGTIASVHADARDRAVGGAFVPTPWHGRFWNYEMRDGMRVPIEGEVSWISPDGPHPYWRGRITGLRYSFER